MFHQTQDKAYLYAEYYQHINNFTFTAGVGAQYTAFHFRESNQGNRLVELSSTGIGDILNKFKSPVTLRFFVMADGTVTV